MYVCVHTCVLCVHVCMCARALMYPVCLCRLSLSILKDKFIFSHDNTELSDIACVHILRLHKCVDALLPNAQNTCSDKYDQ